MRARPTTASVERALTWGADENLLLACSAAGWISARVIRSHLRPTTNHILLVTAAAAIVPHILKRIFDQVRPDRTAVRGHLHGIPLSGKSLDAFPSGHAVHMGALASAASVLPWRYRLLAWSLATGISGTRIAILAHWLSDVIAGFVIGVAIERALRRMTGYPDPQLRCILFPGRKL